MKKYIVQARLFQEKRKAELQSLSDLRDKLEELMNNKKLFEYSLSEDSEKLWLVMEEKSEMDLLHILAEIPGISLIHSEINPLKFYRSVSGTRVYHSLN